MSQGNRRTDLTGQRFGRLVVVRQAGRTRYRDIIWECRCDCGKPRKATTHRLHRGECRSCGCLQLEMLRKRTVTHGRAGRNQHDAVYQTWLNMKARCENPRSKCYFWYGARGIKVCGRWHDFTSFLSDMGERPSPNHSIDRIDPAGNYEPSNCRWATVKQQTENRRPMESRRIFPKVIIPWYGPIR